MLLYYFLIKLIQIQRLFSAFIFLRSNHPAKLIPSFTHIFQAHKSVYRSSCPPDSRLILSIIRIFCKSTKTSQHTANFLRYLTLFRWKIIQFSMPEIPYETGAYYVFDRGYNNFGELYRIQRMESFFVVRAKTNLQYRCVRWQIELFFNMQLKRSTYEVMHET